MRQKFPKRETRSAMGKYLKFISSHSPFKNAFFWVIDEFFGVKIGGRGGGGKYELLERSGNKQEYYD